VASTDCPNRGQGYIGNCALKLWDLQNGSAVRQFVDLADNVAIGKPVFSADGSLVIGTHSKLNPVTNKLDIYEVQFWDVGTAKEIYRLDTGGLDPIVSSDGRLLITFSYWQSTINFFGLK
jgi:hypothetical protein